MKLSDNPFPTSKNKQIAGSRHLAREKVLQVIAATADSEVSLDDAFPHIFYRQFSFDDVANEDTSGRIMHPREVEEMEADIPISWTQPDIDYAIQVIESARDLRESIDELLEKFSKNWDVERMAQMDKNLLVLSIAELVGCSDVPIKVTINEVIELAKRYSTDKSGTFINGLLDAVVTDLTAAGKINKTGRGLK